MLSYRTKEILCQAILDPILPIRLASLSTKNASIWIKREWTDPTGSDPIRSIKRKPACLLYSDVLEKKYASKDKLLISATSGNFGIEVGLLASEWGYPFYAVVPAIIPEYNLAVLRALGIHVIRTTEQESCPREFTVFFVRGYAHEFHHRLVNIEQYYSWLNPLAHSLMTAQEIFSDMDGVPVDYIVASVGSCGTICGIQQYLMATDRDTSLVGVQPALNHGVPGTHIIKGNCTWSPENYSPAILSHESIHVADSVDAYAFTTLLWMQGIPAGPSTGMALAQAYRMIREGAKGNIMVISPDNNFKYGDLIADKLIETRDDILTRYPELDLSMAIEAYQNYLESHAGLDWMLQRIRECYANKTPGKEFEARQIEDIVSAGAFEATCSGA